MAEKRNEQRADSSKAIVKTEEDSKFVVKATSCVTMETELGRYAEKNAVSTGVKLFGETMLKDYSKDKESLKRLASDKKITIPTRTGDDFQNHIDEITSKKGIDFDKACISFIVSDHKDDITELEKEARNGKDTDIKAFTVKGISVLQHHTKMAKLLNNKFTRNY